MMGSMHEIGESVLKRRALWSGPCVRALTALVIGCVVSAQVLAQGKLTLYNWEDYIDPAMVTDFSKKYRVTLQQRFFSSTETQNAKLMAGDHGFDVVVTTAAVTRTQMEAKLFRPLDKSKIPNLAHLDKAFMKKLETIDPDNRYFVPWAWGWDGVAINTQQVKNALGNKAMPQNIWALIFNPEYAALLKNCGIAVLDAPIEMMDIALIYKGYLPDQADLPKMREAANLLKSIRPYIKTISNTEGYAQLSEGRVCVLIGWSGEMVQAAKIGKEKGHSIEVRLPEKTLIWVDLMGISAQSTQVDNAHQWINYVLEPQVSAQLMQFISYPNANGSAQKLLPADFKNNSLLFPTEKETRHFIPLNTITSEHKLHAQRLLSTFLSEK